jgi:hypothetical protein
MIRIAIAAAALLAAPSLAQEAGPPQGPAKPLSIQQQAALKCSAAFALGAAAQARGDATRWPELGLRGREFFVRTSAAIMDETGRSRDQVAAELGEQARVLARDRALAAAMPPCLLLLDASGI